MTGNSKDSKILAYKDMINQLNKTISTQTELIQSLQKTLEADRLEKENLRQQIEYLTKKLFGTSSEKRKDIAGQLNLFDEAEQAVILLIWRGQRWRKAGRYGSSRCACARLARRWSSCQSSSALKYASAMVISAA